MNIKLKNKTVLITGSTGGMGEAIVDAFLNEEAIVIGHFRKNDSRSLKLQKKLGSRGIPIKADLTNEKEVSAMFNLANKTFGRIDILVTTAAIWPNEFSLLSQLTFERWKDVFNNNVNSVFLCSREFFRNLEKYPSEFASLVFIGSVAGTYGLAGKCDYSASKAAIMYGLTKSLKNEIIKYAKYGRVNCISPGYTKTPMTEKHLSNINTIKKAMQTMSLTKIASVQDIALFTTILCSDYISGHISGELITISGGMEGRILHEKDEIKPYLPKK